MLLNHDFYYVHPVVQLDMASIWRGIWWDRFEGKTILITGANGHIATYIVCSFAYAVENLGLRAKIIALSRDLEGLRRRYAVFWEKEWFEAVVADISHGIGLCEKVDYVFHLAGNSSPEFIARDPVGIMKTHLVGMVNVCDFARKCPLCKVVLASTREVYGAGNQTQALDETGFGRLDPIDARSCYPEAKRGAEAVLAAYHRQYGLRYAIARIAHCYGPGMKWGDGRIMSDVIAGVVADRHVELLSDGSAVRSFCYISDVVTALLLMADRGDAGVFNLSNETEEISVLNLARLVSRLAGGAEIEVKGGSVDKNKYCGYKRIPLDCSQLQNLGWHPRVGLEEGLIKTLQSLKDVIA